MTSAIEIRSEKHSTLSNVENSDYTQYTLRVFHFRKLFNYYFHAIISQTDGQLVCKLTKTQLVCLRLTG